jgi:hypothetical protein
VPVTPQSVADRGQDVDERTRVRRAAAEALPARGLKVHVGVRAIPCARSISSVRVLPNVTKSMAVAVHVAVHVGHPTLRHGGRLASGPVVDDLLRGR